MEEDAPLWELDTVRTDILLAKVGLERILKEAEDRSREIEAELKLVQQHITARKARLEEMKQSGERGPEVQQLITKRQELIDVLAAKQSLLEQLQPLFADWIDQFKRIQQALADLSKEVGGKIQERIKGDLFHQYYGTFSLFDRATIRSELEIIRNAGLMMVTIGVWNKELSGLWIASGYSLRSDCLSGWCCSGKRSPNHPFRAGTRLSNRP